MSSITQSMTISDVRSEFESLVERVHDGETRILVEKSGVPVAALVSPEDLGLIDDMRCEQAREQRLKIVDEMPAAFADVSGEETERETARALAEVRSEARREEAFEAMREISRAFADVPVEELERQVELAVLEVRAQMRAERAKAAAGNE